MVWHDNAMATYRYSTERRNDPELRAKVAKVVVARQTALQQAAALLKQASEILDAQAGFADGVVYERQRRSVSIASSSLIGDTNFELGTRIGLNPAENEIYLSNLAAGRLGEQIQEMGDKFPL